MKKLTIARLRRGGKQFEILVNPDPAFKYKSGEPIGLDKVLAIDIIYTKASAGERASREDLIKVFGTDNVTKIAEIILKEGELQLTVEQRRRMAEDKLRQIIHILSRNFVDPRTGLPHPPQRIELALKQARFHPDPFKPAEEQIERAVEVLRPILPLKMETVRIEVILPPHYASKLYGTLRRSGDVESEEWLTDGSLKMRLSLLAAVYPRLTDLLARETHGAAIVRKLE
ncbi:ribosome assembly factor SBDS [archaeon]|nr:ribosome assembly factor SBDS [archaeon]